MQDKDKTKDQLINELVTLRRQVAELEPAHKQAKGVLKSSNEYSQALIENSFNSTIIHNSGGSIRYINPSIERPFGWEPEELIGRIVFDLIHQDSLPQVINEGAETRDCAKFLKVKVKHKDDSRRITECMGNKL